MANILEELKKKAEEMAELIKNEDKDASVCIMVANTGYKDCSFFGEHLESYTKYSFSDDWEYAKRPRDYRYSQESHDRDCKNCIHYKPSEYKGDTIYSCESWDCEFESKEDSDD